MHRSVKHLNIPLILELVKRDFVERFAGFALGSLWSFIWPLVYIILQSFLQIFITMESHALEIRAIYCDLVSKRKQLAITCNKSNTN